MHDDLVTRLREEAECPDNYPEDSNLMREAADAIEELSEQLENETEYATALNSYVPQWIPVTERLPDEGKFVLVYGDLYPNKDYGCVIAVSRRIDWNYWQGFGRERNITHWMPLPEPPKESES